MEEVEEKVQHVKTVDKPKVPKDKEYELEDDDNEVIQPMKRKKYG